MRRIIKGLAVVLVAVVALSALAGCTDQTAEANQAIDAANAHVKKYTAAGTELEKLMGEAEKLPMDPAGAKKGAALVDQMKAKLDEQKSEAAAAKAEITKIKALKVRDEFKTYADKEIAVTDALLEESPVAQALVTDLGKIYALVASGKATQAQVEEIGKRIDTESKQLAEIEAKAAKLEKEASTYFEEKQLGGK